MRIYPKGVAPERFNRGSTVLLTTTLGHVEWVGGPVPVLPVVSPVEPPLKHAGMTVFGTKISLMRQAAGN